MVTDQAARSTLAAEQERAAARLAALERDFAHAIDAAAGSNSDDEHDPEGATIAFERQHIAALIEQAADQLRQIDAALGLLNAGTYGRCQQCGQPIGLQRLAARPTATECIGCAQQRS